MKTSLRYSTDSEPGITRVTSNGAVAYRHASGRAVRDPSTLRRIGSLGIPPAWTEVWICASTDGHLQATGRDARRRKQYLYHPVWVDERDSNKFDALGSFASALPRIRRAVRRDLSMPELTKERVLAAVVQLMDRTFVRVGGERYRRENGSFGLTTLRNRHAKANGAVVSLDFRGKSGKRHHVQLEDARVAKVIRHCLDLPGQVLFQYQDADELRSISAQDVNDYLRQISGALITSKDFRTWGATVCVAARLAEAGRAETKAEMHRQLREAINAAAKVLGNTPAVCKRSYVAPAVFAHYEAGTTFAVRMIDGMRKAECMVAAMLAGRTRRRSISSPADAGRAAVGAALS
ncbi:MAG TPA: DNA topoisomerase IB [Casimicrobiaceae bacterium]|nr:DNA topoisomerase IB [Casimicrobiaceae bacterium]